MPVPLSSYNPFRIRMQAKVRQMHQREVAAAKAKTHHYSTSTFPYEPTYTDNLRYVDIKGRAVLANAKKLEDLKSGGFALRGCEVGTRADGQRGSVECRDTNVGGVLHFGGRTLKMQNCTVLDLQVSKRDNRYGFPLDGRQIVRIVDSKIIRLSLRCRELGVHIVPKKDGPFSNSFTSKDGKFELHLVNVTLCSVQNLCDSK